MSLSEGMPCRPECLYERARNGSVAGGDQRLHSGVPLRELDELRPEVLTRVPDVRNGVDRDCLRRRQSRVGRLVPRSLLLEVDGGDARIRVFLVFLCQVLRFLEEGRQGSEYGRPIESREPGAPTCEAGLVRALTMPVRTAPGA